jgi:hypothetical protein
MLVQAQILNGPASALEAVEARNTLAFRRNAGKRLLLGID